MVGVGGGKTSLATSSPRSSNSFSASILGGQTRSGAASKFSDSGKSKSSPKSLRSGAAKIIDSSSSGSNAGCCLEYDLKEIR